MDKAKRFTHGLRQPGHIATLTVVGLAYFVTIIAYIIDVQAGAAPYPLSRLLWVIALGIAYLWLYFGGTSFLESLAGRHATSVWFILAISLMLAIEFLVGGRGGIWLIAMPLVATAVTELPPRRRWIVYALVLLGMALPIYVASGDWREALFQALTFSPAIVFVAVFVRLAQQAEEAQATSEALAAELEAANQQLAAYAVEAEELATVQERNRLAREIHDNLGHYLTVVNVQIKAAQAVMAKDSDRAALALEKAQQLTQDGLSAVRQSVSALRDSPLGSRPLPESLHRLTDELGASGIVCTMVVNGEPRPLDPRAELTLYRATQEGLTNVRKHARASRVDVSLDYTVAGAVTLCLNDNGVGAANAAPDGRFGLLGLRERARQLGGTLTVETAPGAGFGLCLTLPTTAVALPPTAGALPMESLT
jgi:signal transduction histidine kinase